MRSPTVLTGVLCLAVAIRACSSGPSGTASLQPGETPPASTPTPPAASEPRTLLADTDVAGDDLVAPAFLLASTQVSVAAITVSGTGEAHCAGGVEIVLSDLFAANPWMTDGWYFLWDPLAAVLAAGYPVGAFSPACIEVEEVEGRSRGSRAWAVSEPNSQYLATVDAAAAEATLLRVLNGGRRHVA